MFKYFEDFQYFLKYTILLVFLPSVFTGFYPGKITVMTAICGWILLVAYFNFKRNLFFYDFEGKNILKIFLAQFKSSVFLWVKYLTILM